MLDLETVKGIVITKDGNYYPFGKQQSPDQKVLTSDNYHDTAFKKDIVPQKWFQDLNYNFSIQNMYYHTTELSSKGLIFIFHDVIPPNNPIYIIQTTINLTDEQKNFFKENYQYLRELNNKPNTIFEATAYNQDRSSVYRTCVDNLDQFYELLHIKKTYKLK